MKKVITHGSFDLFHEGQFSLLKRARELGDYLVVGITTEQYDAARGKLNVVDSLITRIDNVRATGLADEVIIIDHAGQIPKEIRRLNIDVFTVGSDWEGKFDYLKSICDVVYLERTRNVSSTESFTTNKPLRSIVRMGIVGTGRIAARFPQEAKYVSGVNVYGAYNGYDEHAKEYVEEQGLSFWTDDFDDLLEHVDAVYIASPHETHYEYARKALNKHKHVLCEKPMVLKGSEARELFDLAEKNNCVLMEALKTAYCPGFKQIMDIAKSGAIGEIRDVEAAFSRLTDDDVREMTDTNYGGSFTEFGSYCLLPIIKLLGYDFKDVRFDSLPLDNGLDAYTKVTLKYDNAFGMTKNGVAVKTEGQLIIAGTEGYILAESPWWLTRKFEVRYEDPNRIERYEPAFLGTGLRYEIAEFSKAIERKHNSDNSADEDKKMEIYGLSNDDSIVLAEIMERFLEVRVNNL